MYVKDIDEHCWRMLSPFYVGGEVLEMRLKQAAKRQAVRNPPLSESYRLRVRLILGEISGQQ